MSVNPEDYQHNEDSEEEVEIDVEESDVDEQDDDVDKVDGIDDVASVNSVSKPASTVASEKPGKVKPSEAVKKMDIPSPEKPRPSGSKSLNPTRNPFPSVGGWTPEMLNQITVEFPTLNATNETTNELTRKTKPEARYWKGPIMFRYGNFTSDTIRVDNVPIPYHDGTDYGENFIYIALPGYFAEKFAEAGKTKRPTKVTENSLVPDPERWWKIANKVGDVFGVINPVTKKFINKSLATILQASRGGVTASLILRFKNKASTISTEPIKYTTVGTIAVEIERGFITELDVPVQKPTKVPKKTSKAAPPAIPKDIASDDLMKKLNALGV